MSAHRTDYKSTYKNYIAGERLKYHFLMKRAMSGKTKSKDNYSLLSETVIASAFDKLSVNSAK